MWTAPCWVKCLHVRGDDGDLNERSSSFSGGDPVSKDLISLLLCVKSSLRLFFTIIWLVWSESESQLLGDMFDSAVTPVAEVTAELLSQTRSLFGCGFNVIVTVDAICWTGSTVSVTEFSLIFTTIIRATDGGGGAKWWCQIGTRGWFW